MSPPALASDGPTPALRRARSEAEDSGHDWLTGPFTSDCGRAVRNLHNGSRNFWTVAWNTSAVALFSVASQS